MTTSTVQLHRTEKGNWVKCTASVRACPRGQHVTIAGEASDAAQFFDELGQTTREDIRVTFETEAQKTLVTWSGIDSEAAAAARESFDARARSLQSYVLPKPMKPYTELTQEQRYAQSVTNMALHFLADRGAGQPRGTESAPLAKLERDCTSQAKTFAGVGAGDQEATQVSLAQVLTVLRQNAHEETLYGKTQLVVDIRPAMFALEGKYSTLDPEYKNYAAEPAENSTANLLADAQRSFAARSSDWDRYEYPAGLDGVSSPADNPRKSAAQAMTREAIMALIGERFESFDVSGGAAPYTAVRAELKEFAAADPEDIPSYNPHLRSQSIEQRKAWLREIDAVLRTEASVQEVAGANLPMVDLKAAVRALEERGLSSDLNPAAPSTVPAPQPTQSRVVRRRAAAQAAANAEFELPDFSDAKVQAKMVEKAAADVDASQRRRVRRAQREKMTPKAEMENLRRKDQDEHDRLEASLKAKDAERRYRLT